MDKVRVIVWLYTRLPDGPEILRSDLQLEVVPFSGLGLTGLNLKPWQDNGNLSQGVPGSASKDIGHFHLRYIHQYGVVIARNPPREFGNMISYFCLDLSLGRLVAAPNDDTATTALSHYI